MTELLLVRHGQAAHNLTGRWEGWSATPLTEEGERQAEALAQRLAFWTPRIGQIVTSPLRRARQTAEPVGRYLGLPIQGHDGLREINFGQVSGLTMEGLCETMPDVYARWQDRSDMTFEFPGGEQRAAFFERVARALDDVIENAGEGPVVVVAHGGTLRAGLAYLFPDTMRDWWGYALENASLTQVQVGSQGNILAVLNDRLHLDGGRPHE